MNLISQEQNGLTPYIFKEVNKILKAHKNDPTQLVGILLDIQNFTERHYIPQPVAEYISKKLEIPSTRVFDVISFYSELHDKPRAKYPIEICDSVVCKVNDSENLLEMLINILGIQPGQITYDGRFIIEKVPCFGACDISPAVRINGKVFGNLKTEQDILNMLGTMV